MPLGEAKVEPGATLPGTRYRIIRKLGDGGMGTVYEAEHVDIERRVALKILRPELTRTPDIVEQFRREARAASKVGADQIVQVFDFAELPDGRVLFTMELVEGPTLRDELRNGPISAARTIGLLRQVCKGLDAAHKAGVVHRDVKPDNIVLMRRGRADAIKLLDFGIAVMMGEEQLRPMSAGTPHYLAPELVAGASFDRRADVYAVGCTAYEMLVGKPPFGRIGHDVEEVLGSHLADIAEAPSKVRPDLHISAALDRVIMRCLAKLPSNRFRNMGELEAALCAAQIDASLQTSWDDLQLPDEVDPELRERLLREMPDLVDPLPRRRRWVVPTIAVLSLAIGVGATYVWATRRAQQQEQATAVDPLQVLVDEARAAAARSAYVYPTSDDPQGATAYAKVRQLEARGDADSIAAAAGLRAELAATLVHLGDSYWDLPDGRAFAIEYYTQALVFDREDSHAKARASVVPDQLESLARKAEQGAFTPQEIAAAEPLRVLAQAQESKRAQKVGPAAPTTTAAAPTKAGDEVAPLGDAHPDEGEPVASDLPAKPAQAGADEQAGADDLAKSAAKLLKSGMKADAEEMFRRALTYDPNNALALRSMYDIEAGRGRYEDALEIAERLVANAPGVGGNHVRVGDAAMKLREYKLARKSYDRAASLGATEAAARLAKLNEVSPPPAVAEPTADGPDAKADENSKDPSDEKRDDPDDAEAPPAGSGAPPEGGATSVSQ